MYDSRKSRPLTLERGTILEKEGIRVGSGFLETPNTGLKLGEKLTPVWDGKGGFGYLDTTGKLIPLPSFNGTDW